MSEEFFSIAEFASANRTGCHSAHFTIKRLDFFPCWLESDTCVLEVGAAFAVDKRAFFFNFPYIFSALRCSKKPDGLWLQELLQQLFLFFLDIFFENVLRIIWLLGNLFRGRLGCHNRIGRRTSWHVADRLAACRSNHVAGWERLAIELDRLASFLHAGYHVFLGFLRIDVVLLRETSLRVCPPALVLLLIDPIILRRRRGHIDALVPLLIWLKRILLEIILETGLRLWIL